MNIDHFHFKVQYGASRTAIGTHGQFDGKRFDAVQRTQKDAIALVKRRATPHSIRGLLCPGRYTGCNRLMGRIDKPEWLRNVLHYLENPPAKKVLDLLPKI